jgi:hypothetical protein
MTALLRRSPAHVLAALLLLTVFTLAPGQGEWRQAEAQDKTPSKLAAPVQRMLNDMPAQGAQQSSLARAPIDLSALSNPLVHVDAAGRIELVFHAAGTIGAAEVTDLQALAWVPYQQVEAAAALPWVVAVTPPSYGEYNIGSMQSEGVALHNADVAQAQGFNGTGVTGRHRRDAGRRRQHAGSARAHSDHRRVGAHGW